MFAAEGYLKRGIHRESLLIQIDPAHKAGTKSAYRRSGMEGLS